MCKFCGIKNRFKNSNIESEKVACFSKSKMEHVMKFHSSIPNYRLSPFHSLSELSKYLGVNNICLKEEVYDF